MSKITNTKLNRRRYAIAGYDKEKRPIRGKFVGYEPVSPRRESFVTMTPTGGRLIKIQVFLSDGEAVNPKRRFKREMKRRMTLNIA